MAEIATNFPPQTYSSSFFLNALADEEKSSVGNDSEATKKTDNSPLLDCFITTMFQFIFVLFFINLYPAADGVECSVPREQKTRIFDSLVHYQGNKIPFNFSNGGWQGSNVEFNTKSLEILKNNDLLTYDSQSIIKLKLSGKNIKKVEDGAFTSLFCLQELFLDHNNVTKLTKNIFSDLNNLLKLDLSYNRIEAIEDLTFSHLSKLKSLDLGNNRIKTVETLAFINLTNLEYLNLEHNEIRKVTDNLFKFVPNLTTLIFSWNQLFDIETEKWGDLTKLLHLELAGNNLRSFYPMYNQSFINLRSLNLSFNSLTTLNVDDLKRHLPQLELIDINNNPWFCEDLQLIIHELNDSKIKLLSSKTTVKCSEMRFSPTPIAEITKSTNRQSWITKEELQRYVEKKLEDSNDELNSSIESVRTLVIFVFALICIYIVFEILFKSNICGVLYNRLRGGNELYADDHNDMENFRLLHR